MDCPSRKSLANITADPWSTVRQHSHKRHAFWSVCVCVWDSSGVYRCVCRCIYTFHTPVNPCIDMLVQWGNGRFGTRWWHLHMASHSLLHLLIYSFSTAEDTLRPMWLFPWAKVPRELPACFLIQFLQPFPNPHLPPRELRSLLTLFCGGSLSECVIFCGSNLITVVQQSGWQAVNVAVTGSLFRRVSVWDTVLERRNGSSSTVICSVHTKPRP